MGAASQQLDEAVRAGLPKGGAAHRRVPVSSKQSRIYVVAEDLGEQHERGFRRVMFFFMVLTISVGLLVPWINVPEPRRDAVQKLPPHLAKVMIKKRAPKPKEPPKQPLAKVMEPEPKVAPKPPPEPKPKAAEKPKPKKEKIPLKKVSKPVEKKPEETVAKARQKAATAGVFAAQDVLADMRKTLTRSQPNAQPRRLSNNGQRAVQPGDSALQAKAVRTSGIAQKSVMMRVTTPEPTLSKSDVAVKSDVVTTPPVVKKASSKESNQVKLRSEAEIRRVFDQHKGAIDSLYRRALRRDPGLQGRVLVEVVIEPTGAISSARIVESELNNQSHEARLLARIRLINFGSQSVAQQKVQYAFEFVPS